jgi:putative hydroxymethylpyrimidine transport system ATP-binding protein
MTGAVIQLKNIYRVFDDTPNTVEALVDVNLSVRSNEFVSIVGPSGCGKSTLLKIMAGLDGDYTGTAYVNGQDVRDARPSVCLMPQQDLLMPWRSVLENVALPLELRGVPRVEREAQAARYFEEFGLSGFERAWPDTLSGGMRQRAALLRTFLCEGDVFLMDEPFAALDALTRYKMRVWLLDIWSRHQKAVVFVTHDIEEAVFLSDRVCVLSERPATVTEIIDIALPRPRPRDIVETPAFIALRRAVRAVLER